MLSICHFGTKGIFILRTFVCNTICVFNSQYSGGTNFCHLYCLIWTKLFCFQFQERFSTEDTLWRGLETLGTLICFWQGVHFRESFWQIKCLVLSSQQCSGSSLLFGQVELFVFVPETFESELDTGFRFGFDATGRILE